MHLIRRWAGGCAPCSHRASRPVCGKRPPRPCLLSERAVVRLAGSLLVRPSPPIWRASCRCTSRRIRRALADIMQCGCSSVEDRAIRIIVQLKMIRTYIHAFYSQPCVRARSLFAAAHRARSIYPRRPVLPTIHSVPDLSPSKLVSPRNGPAFHSGAHLSPAQSSLLLISPFNPHRR